jgi:hypothetical protein
VELLNLLADNLAAVVSPNGETLLGRPLTKVNTFVKVIKLLFVYR